MRQVGDKYRPVATVLREKNGTPAKLLVSGEEYELLSEHEKMKKDYINLVNKMARQTKVINDLRDKLDRRKANDT